MKPWAYDRYWDSICRQACSCRVSEMLAFVRLLGVIRKVWFLPVSSLRVGGKGAVPGWVFRRLVGG